MAALDQAIAYFSASCRDAAMDEGSPALGEAVHIHVLHPVL